MKAKSAILSSVIFLTLAVAAYSQPADLAGYRIFINPGHGGYDSDDRHMLTTDFWESQGNLVKGLYLRQILTNLNATTFMSRTTNTTADDLPLSSISAMANAANVDFFLAIHSNGFAGTQNQPLMLFRGYDDQPVYPLSKTMANIMWQKVFENGNCWTNTNLYVKGDWTFYPEWGDKVGLGVLRNLTMPGVLSEGSHHDYISESWRLRNNDFLHHESWALTRSFLQLWNITPLNHGVITGIIRDPLKSPTWYFKAGTKDQYLPLNGSQVTLMPGNKTYQVDNLNNGFFMFDSIAPGNYSLYISGPAKYMNDTVEVVVLPNKSTLAEVYLQFDTTMVPELLSVTPLFADSLMLTEEITFTFSQEMNRDSVQKSIVFSPAVPLNYTWNTGSNVLKVQPTTQFTTKTEYTITVLQSACTRWKVRLDKEYSYSFLTINRTQLKLEQSYPLNGQTGVTLFPQIRFVFDAPVDPALIPANITIKDDQGVELQRIRQELLSIGGKGHYRFDLSEPLALDKTYTITIKSTLADLGGTPFGVDRNIQFTTRTEEYPAGVVIEPFDDFARFWDPEASGSTVGTDNPLTTFTQSTQILKSGTSAGKLDYVLVNPSGGVVRVFNSQKPLLSYSPSKYFGVWVYGDLSFNELEYWFYSSGNINQITPIATIDWAGWDFKTIPMTDIGGTGDRNFHSVVIRQTPAGAKSGSIYFDEALLCTTVGVDDIVAAPQSELTVYPNPFSTATNISIEIPVVSKVRIDVISLSGQLAERIIDEEVEAGRTNLEYIPAPSLQPGIYLLRMEVKSGDGKLISVSSTKFVLVK